MSKTLNPFAWADELLAANRALFGGARMDLVADETRRTELLAILENPPADADLAALATEAEELSTRIDAARTARTRAAEARARLLGQGAGSGEVTPEQRGAGGGSGEGEGGGGTRVLSAGEVFTESESFVQFRNRGATGTAQIVLPGDLRSTRAVIDNTATSGGAFQNPPHVPEIIPQNMDRAPRLADLIDRRNTSNNTVEYVQDTTAAGGGSPAEVAEGALKPESTYTFVVVSEPVRTIAHWVNLTRQSVDDNLMLQGYVEGRLAYGLENRLDSQILNGNGTSPNLRGILNVSGIGSYAAGAGEAALISVRRMITVAQLSEYAPDTAVMNPTDWERIELSTDSTGEFRISPNAQNSLSPRVWGLNVVVTTAIAALTVLVGAMRLGATLWERQGTTLLMTDSHASNFTSNILTLLAERRGGLAVWRPKAFVKGTLATGTA